MYNRCIFLHGNKADFSFDYVIYKTYKKFSKFHFRSLVSSCYSGCRSRNQSQFLRPFRKRPRFCDCQGTLVFVFLSIRLDLCLYISPSILFFLLWQKPISLFLRLTFIIIYKKKKERKKKNNVEIFF